jgi:Na+-transporting NADH:ubiquinone oxidoreductase subunit B
MNRGLWERETVALMLLICVLPLALVWLWLGGGAAAGRLALVLLVSALWHLLFMLVRAQAPSFAALVSALGIAMLAPPGLGPFALAFGVSFGVVIGELIFGGWGRNLVNPATVALSFLGFAFPAADWPALMLPLAWAAIPAAGLGVVLGVMPGGVIGGAVLTGAGALALGLVPADVAVAAAVALVLVVAEPVTSAATHLGRWLNGGLFAALVALFATGWVGAAPVQIAVAAALLASLAAPLLDEIAVALWTARQRRPREP